MTSTAFWGFDLAPRKPVVETFDLGGTRGGAEDVWLRVGDRVFYGSEDPAKIGSLFVEVTRIWAVYERGVFVGTKVSLRGGIGRAEIRIDTPSDDKRISQS